MNHSTQFQQQGQQVLSASPRRSHNDRKPLPLPEGASATDIDGDEDFVHEFARNDVRELIHCITQELKLKGSKTPLLLLAFRPKISDTKLSEFLTQVIPNGNTPAHLTVLERAVKNTDEYTLITALKYLWARLPMHAIVGWESYETFKRLEARDNYPKKAFLEHMPQCLSSPSHASIVYDFLDLIVAFASNSKENQLSGRKIARMSGIWAFSGLQNVAPKTNSFGDGLRDWIPAADAMFHLLLSFLRSMLPEDTSTKLQLPRTLQALLASNSYPPPPDMTYFSTTVVSVPLVTIKSNVWSNSPMELINKIPKVLKFDTPDGFQAKEDFALLKSLCKTDDNILNKLSSESRRIVQALCQRPSDTNLRPSWPEYRSNPKFKEREPEVQVSRVSIDDYFIWTWLASISFEQTVVKKKVFGRSLIVEVVFDGFKKWIIVEEVNDTTRVIMPPVPEKQTVKKTFQPHYKSMLDDIPVDRTMDQKKKKKSKKSKSSGPQPIPKPLPKPLPNIQIKPKEKGRSVANMLNPIKKQRVPQPYQQPVAMPRPQPARHISDYRPLEDVGGLPEIETNQYRLSIPLDSFGFDVDMEEPQQDYDQYNQYNQNDQYAQQAHYLRPGHYDSQVQRAPQDHYAQQDPYMNQSHSQQHNERYNEESKQQYKYWSSVESEELRNKNESSPQALQSAYDNAMAMLEPSYPYDDDNHAGGSIHNLSSMVDELSVQVNHVETKLGQSSVPMFDVQVPLPQQELEHPFNQPDDGSQRQIPRSMDYQDENVPPSEAGSSVYGRIPSTYTSEPEESPVTPSAGSYLSESNSFNQDTPIVYPKQRSQDNCQKSSPQRVRSMVEDVMNVPPAVPRKDKRSPRKQPPPNSRVEVRPPQEEYCHQPSPKVVAYESDDRHRQLANDSQERRESQQSESTLLQDRLSAFIDENEPIYETPIEERRMSSISDSTNKYPDSILDGYGYTTSESSPSKTQQREQIVTDIPLAKRIPNTLSMRDVKYIPESTLPDIPIPAPSPPRSPIARRSPSPEHVHKRLPDQDCSQAFIETVPVLTPYKRPDPSQASSATCRSHNDSFCTAPSSPSSTPNYNGQKAVSSMIVLAQKVTHETSVNQVSRISPAESSFRSPLRETVQAAVSTPAPQRKAPSKSPVRHYDNQGRDRRSPSPNDRGGYSQSVSEGDSSVSSEGFDYASQQRGSETSVNPRPNAANQNYLTAPQNDSRHGLRPTSMVSPNAPRTSSPLGPNRSQSPYTQGQFPPPQVPPQGHYYPQQQQQPKRSRNDSASSSPAPQGQYPPGSQNQYPLPQGQYPPQGQYLPQGQYYPQQNPKRSSNESASSLPPQQGQYIPGPQGQYPPQQVQPRPKGQSYPHQQEPKRSSNSSASSSPGPQGHHHLQSPMYSKNSQAPRHNSLGLQTGAANGRDNSPQRQNMQQGYYPPPQGYYPPPPNQQGYYPPPQGYYPPPPQAYGPQGYYAPPQGYYPPPQGYGYPQPGQPPVGKPTTGSDYVMQTMPSVAVGNKLHHDPGQKKKNIRAALANGDFGI